MNVASYVYISPEMIDVDKFYHLQQFFNFQNNKNFLRRIEIAAGKGATMKNKILALIAGFFLLVLPLTAQALLIDVTAQSDGGISSATLDFDDLDTATWTIGIYNTSPTTLISGPGVNAPGITGISFDVDDTFSETNINSWTLTAKDSSNNDYTVTTEWDFSTKKFDVEFTTTNGVQYALYNPDPALTTGFGADPLLTYAELVVTFDQAYDLSVVPFGSPMVRFQNVGLDGEGSTKAAPAPVPEPATMLLLGFGLVGLAGFRRKKFKK
jgi:hypothetical protein